MNLSAIKLFSRFLLFVLLQVFVFNKMALFSAYIPLPYVVLVLIYPISFSQKGFYVWSFFVGLIIDVFMNTGGIHATACLILAGLRKSLLELSFGINLQLQPDVVALSFNKEPVLFLVLSIFIHHFIVFLLEAFSLKYIFKIIPEVFVSSLYSILIIMLLYLIVKPQKK